MEDKAEREEFDILFKQLPIFWQDKIVRDSHKRTEGKYWVKFMGIPGVGRDVIEDLLELQGIQVRHLKETHGGFNLQGKTEDDEERLLDLNGGKIEGHPIRIIRTRMQLEAADVFRLVGEHLRATEEAEAMRISLGGKKKVTTQVHHDSSRENTPVRQSSGRGSHHQSRSRSNTPKGDMDFTPKPPGYPPPQAPTYAQAIQYAPPKPPVVQTIPKLPYQVWDPFAAM